MRIGKLFVPALVTRWFSIFTAIKMILTTNALKDLGGFRDLNPF